MFIYSDKNKSSDQAASSSPLQPVALKFNVNDDVKASINTAKDNLDRYKIRFTVKKIYSL